jgi:hypothetical protein
MNIIREEARKKLTDGTIAKLIDKNGKYRIEFDNDKQYNTLFFGKTPEGIRAAHKRFENYEGKDLGNPHAGFGSESAHYRLS